MRNERWFAVVCTVLACASHADARRVTVTPSRTELLNATSSSASCSELFATASAALPLHVTRIEVTPPQAGNLRYEWSLPIPQEGVLIANADIGDDEQASVVRTICAELGSPCILTAAQLAAYPLPSVLYVAPTCDKIGDPVEPYRGGTVKIGVKAFSGKRKVGKGSVTIGYGRLASVTLRLNGKTGDGNRSGVPASLKEEFVAQVDPDGVTLPAIERYRFDNGDGDGATAVTAAFGASALLTYNTAGKHVATVTTDLKGGSSLCDNLLAQVSSAVNRIELEVSRAPDRASYRPGDLGSGTVNVRVRVRNVSSREEGSAVLLEGPGVLTCDTEVKVGKSSLSKTTRIDFQHCSATVEQPCDSDADCGIDACPECEPAERCLAASHCELARTDTFDPLGCVRDADCSRFVAGDRCVTVVPVSSLLIPLGESVDLVTTTVPLANVLASPAKVGETWTVRAKNAPEDSVTDRYTIESNPAVQPIVADR